MKTTAAITTPQRKIYFAGCGVYCAAAFFLSAGKSFFRPLTNEFVSVAFLASAILLFSLAAIGFPKRKSGLSFPFQFLFPLLLNLGIFLLNRENASFSGLKILLSALALGWLSGQLRRQVLHPRNFYLCCLSGLTGGFFLNWIISMQKGTVLFPYVLAGMTAVLLWIICNLIRHSPLPAAGKFMLTTLWILLLLQVWISCRTAGPQVPVENEKESFKPALIVEAALQPDKKDLKVMLLGNDPEIAETFSRFPLTRKLVVIPLEDGVDIFRRLNAESNDFDLVFLLAERPDSLFAERQYSIPFYQLLKDRLGPQGVLVVHLPEAAAFYLKRRGLDLHGYIGSILRQVFPSVKPADRESNMLLCGRRQITNHPEELNRRAESLLPDLNWLPEGVFLMNTAEEMREWERGFHQQTLRAAGGPPRQDHELMWRCICSYPVFVRTGLGKWLDFLRTRLLSVLAVLTVILLILRYFCSGGQANKRNWLSWENGLYTGLVSVLFMVPFQQLTGRLSSDWRLLTGIFLLTGLCGMSASIGRHHTPLLLKLLLGLTLLLPLCGIAFLRGYTAGPVIFYALTGYVGYTAGAVCGDIQAELPLVLLGIAAGFLLCTLLYWLPGGIWFAAVIAILMRIPPAAAENLQKQFDKRKKAYTI